MSEKRTFNPEKNEGRGGISNAVRATRASEMLNHHPFSVYGETDQCIMEALADLMHLCDKLDMEFDGLLSAAQDYYNEEA